MKLNFLKGKEGRNATWIIGGRVIQMLLSVVVGSLTARYLGQTSYGLIGYGSAYVAFFTSLCTLGLNSVIIKDFVDHPDEQGEAIGSALVLRIVSSLLSVFMISGIVFVVDYGEMQTLLVVALCSLGLVFHVFETFNFWFQSQYRSKITTMATLAAYVVMSLYKIVLLLLGAGMEWFAFAMSVDYIVIAIFLYVAYRRYQGPRLRFSLKKSKSLLSVSYHYILSALMIAIYGQTDKIMLRQMLPAGTGDAAVGDYTMATTICAMWVFVLQAIIDSLYPTILNLYGKDKAGYEKKNRQLYAIVFYVSLAVSVGFQLLGGLVIDIYGGAEYATAVTPLKIVTWYTAFSYLGVARNAWIVSEKKQKYLKYLYGSAAVLNVILNLALIPLWGVSGAAAASLVTQIATSILLPLCFRELRPNAKLMLEAICFQKLR